MLLCDRGDNTVKVLPPDGTVILQSFIASNCDKSPSSALGHNDMFFVSMVNYVKVFNNEGEFLYDTGTGLAVDKFDSLLVGDDKNAQVFTLEGKFVNSIRRQVLQLQNPLAVAVSNAGQVFIIDIGKHCVHIFE